MKFENKTVMIQYVYKLCAVCLFDFVIYIEQIVMIFTLDEVQLVLIRDSYNAIPECIAGISFKF